MLSEISEIYVKAEKNNYIWLYFLIKKKDAIVQNYRKNLEFIKK